MPQGIPHRIMLAGIDEAARAAVAEALRGRVSGPAVSHATAEEALADALAHPGEMHLIVAGPSVVGALAEGLPGQPVLALLPPGAAMSAVLAAQRAGAAQVAALPLQRDDFLDAIDCIVKQYPVPVRQGKLIAVCGVTGGCGATTLALALSQELAARTPPGRPGCLLIEVPGQVGSLAAYLGISPRLTTYDILSDPTRLTGRGLAQAVTAVSPGLDVLAGPFREITPGSAHARALPRLAEAARGLASAAVIDLPCTFDAPWFETLALADRVLLVGVQTVASVRALRMVRDMLVREEGLQSIEVVVNRHDHALPGFDAAKLAEVLRVPEVRTVAADFASVSAAVNHARPLREAAPFSPVVGDVHRLASAILGQRPAPPPSPSEVGVRRVHVLHIEDDPVLREVVAIHLGRMKDLRCTVAGAADEETGLELYRKERPDLTILDYHLPQGDGMSCLLKLRALDPLLPILVVSGVNEPGIAAGLLEAGADDFLSKENLGGEPLHHSVRAVLERTGAVKARRGAGRPEEELLALAAEVREASPPGRFSVGTIQRLADGLCAELEKAAGGGATLPRRAVLALLLRLFGSAG
jgi:pilus assembly protein CpaE